MLDEQEAVFLLPLLMVESSGADNQNRMISNCPEAIGATGGKFLIAESFHLEYEVDCSIISSVLMMLLLKSLCV